MWHGVAEGGELGRASFFPVFLKLKTPQVITDFKIHFLPWGVAVAGVIIYV